MIPHVPISLVKEMFEASVKCIRDYPNLKDHPFKCENVYWTPVGEGSFTLHTHTMADAVDPSDADINTTENKLKKRFLCIINTDNKDLTCWDTKKGYDQPVLKKNF